MDWNSCPKEWEKYYHWHDLQAQFNNSLSDILEIIQNENKQLIIIGDINIDLIKCETHQFTSDYLDMIYSNACLLANSNYRLHSNLNWSHIY